MLSIHLRSFGEFLFLGTVHFSMMHGPFWPLVILVVSIPPSVSPLEIPSFTQTRKIFLTEYSGNCEGKIYPYSHFNYTYTRNGSYTLMSGDLTAFRDIGTPLPAEFRITKCQDRSDLSTCKLQNSFKWQDICQWTKLNAVPFIKMFAESTQPPARCPIKKGIYRFRDVKLPTDLITTLLAGGDYKSRALWIFRLTLHEGHEIVSCFEGGFRVANARIRL